MSCVFLLWIGQHMYDSHKPAACTCVRTEANGMYPPQPHQFLPFSAVSSSLLKNNQNHKQTQHKKTRVGEKRGDSCHKACVRGKQREIVGTVVAAAGQVHPFVRECV